MAKLTIGPEIATVELTPGKLITMKPTVHCWVNIGADLVVADTTCAELEANTLYDKFAKTSAADHLFSAVSPDGPGEIEYSESEIPPPEE